MAPRTLSRPAPSRRSIAFGTIVLALTVALLTMALRYPNLPSVLAHAQVGWVLLACGATAVSLLAAVRNLTAFAPLRLPLLDTLRAQLAVCGLRVIAPSAVSTPAICARYLTRSGLGTAEALTVVGTAQAAQLLTTVVVVCSLAAFGVENVSAPDPVRLTVWIAAAVVLLVVTFLVARRIPSCAGSSTRRDVLCGTWSSMLVDVP